MFVCARLKISPSCDRQTWYIPRLGTFSGLESFRFAGRAIVITTLVLTLGFLPLVLSDYLSIRMIGILLPGTLIGALLTDLLLLPALVVLGPLAMGGGQRVRAP